ncbi:hypothetical protein [Sphingomicrobium astaxanthinifaciens]|uniref:hypothetical protein n=1 Tax=Sphingomicrobium astaxanthinifaciens TaxID=1227949 RepID=UPI001FCC0526|nr:hypothetical protein [Sphingomicrobium astaxanthinifaciens]MCJ7421830.1 hypothetical protein [Sphingomicrobium astaxanthinifaciens]
MRSTLATLAALFTLGCGSDARVPEASATIEASELERQVDAGIVPGMTINADGSGTLLHAPPWTYMAGSADKGSRDPDPSAPLVPPDLEPRFLALARYVPPPPPPPPPGTPPPTLAPRTLEVPPMTYGKLKLVNGCLEVHPVGAAARPYLLPPDMRLFRDAEGYLALGQPDWPANRNIRIGEMGYWMGSGMIVEEADLPAALRKKCHARSALYVQPRSRAATEAASREQAALRLAKTYGVSVERASAYLDACRKRTDPVKGIERLRIAPPCGAPSPPPPVEDEADCPEGTRLVAFTCRTPEGYLRPLPAGLAG